MTDRNKIKLINAGYNLFKIFGVPAKEIRILGIDATGSLRWTLFDKYKTVGATKEAFEDLMKEDKNLEIM